MFLLNHLLLAASLLLPAVLGQTPPGYCPSVEKNLEVKYPSFRATPGVTKSVKETKTQPTLHLGSEYSADKNARYVAIMVDISVIIPNTTTATYFLHWYQPDLALSSTGELKSNPVNAGAGPAAEYIGPVPPEGVHGYVFLLYRQPEDYQFPGCYAGMLPVEVNGRVGFDIKAFTKVAGLGMPVAANWIKVPTDKPSATVVKTTETKVKEVVCATGFMGSWTEVKTGGKTKYGRGGRGGRGGGVC